MMVLVPHSVDPVLLEHRAPQEQLILPGAFGDQDWVPLILSRGMNDPLDALHGDDVVIVHE